MPESAAYVTHACASARPAGTTRPGKGTWNGVFYPPRGAAAKGFDELAFYAEHFDTVEVNSTFYGQPRAEVSRAWAERTPPGFEFSVKLYQKFTHPRMFKERVARTLPATRAARRTLLDALARPNAADLDEFRRGIDPLASSGQARRAARAVSRQLQGRRRASRDYLAGLLRALRRLPGRRRAAAPQLERRASARRWRC